MKHSNLKETIRLRYVFITWTETHCWKGTILSCEPLGWFSLRAGSGTHLTATNFIQPTELIKIHIFMAKFLSADELDLLTAWPDHHQATGCMASHHLPAESTEPGGFLPPSALIPLMHSSAAAFLLAMASSDRLTGLKSGKIHDHHPSSSRQPDLKALLELEQAVFLYISSLRCIFSDGVRTSLTLQLHPERSCKAYCKIWVVQAYCKISPSQSHFLWRALLPFLRLIPCWEGGKKLGELSTSSVIILLEI